MSDELIQISQQIAELDRKLDFLINSLGKQSKDNDVIYNSQQAADYLHLSLSRIYCLISEGKLEPIQRKRKGRILFSPDSLNSYLSQNA